MRRSLFIALLVLALSPLARAETNFSVDVLDGVPYLVEFGAPQGTGFTATTRKRVSLDGEWRFRIDPGEIGERDLWNGTKIDESSWDRQSVPGVWQAQDPNLRFYNGVAWYRTTFKAPEEFSDSAIFLKFEGVFLFSKVWLNGVFLGEHEGGYTPFRFDISDYVKPGREYTVVVSCDNRHTKNSVPPQTEFGVFSFLDRNVHGEGSALLKGRTHIEEMAWWPYGGIHGNVYVEAAPRVNVVKVAVTAVPTKEGGSLKVEGIVWNRSSSAAKVKLNCGISSKDESISTYPCGDVSVPAKGYAAFRNTTPIPGVKPWSPSGPNLYDLTVTASAEGHEDSVTSRIGFRTFVAEGGKLKLNGKEIFLYGINRVEDDPAVGLAQNPTVVSNDLDMIQDLGVNFVRPAHNPVHTAFIDECDRRGLLIAEEIPLYQASGGQLTDPLLRSRAKLQLAEMIERDINRPSVVIWSLGSEVWSFTKNAGDLARDLKLAARRIDLVRPVTMALLVVPHLTNRRDFIAPDMDIIFINEYFGWYYGDSKDAGRYVDNMHNTFRDKPIVISEFGAHSLMGYRDPAGRNVMSEEYQADLLMTQIKIFGDRLYVAGIAPWSFADYRSPWYSERAAYPFMSLSGLTDERRLPKKAYYAVKDAYKQLRAKRGTGG